MCNTLRQQLYSPPSNFLSEVAAQPVVKSEQSTPYTIKSERKLDKVTELVPTPDEAVQIAISLVNLQPNDIFVEPGCGDGRILSKAAEICFSIGIELNKDTVKLARQNASRAIVIEGDAANYNYSKATVVSMYLYPDLMEKIVPKLNKGTRVVSYCHTCKGINWTEHNVNGHKFYTGIK